MIGRNVHVEGEEKKKKEKEGKWESEIRINNTMQEGERKCRVAPVKGRQPDQH